MRKQHKPEIQNNQQQTISAFPPPPEIVLKLASQMIAAGCSNEQITEFLLATYSKEIYDSPDDFLNKVWFVIFNNPTYWMGQIRKEFPNALNRSFLGSYNMSEPHYTKLKINVDSPALKEWKVWHNRYLLLKESKDLLNQYHQVEARRLHVFLKRTINYNLSLMGSWVLKFAFNNIDSPELLGILFYHLDINSHIGVSEQTQLHSLCDMMAYETRYFPQTSYMFCGLGLKNIRQSMTQKLLQFGADPTSLDRYAYTPKYRLDLGTYRYPPESENEDSMITYLEWWEIVYEEKTFADKTIKLLEHVLPKPISNKSTPAILILLTVSKMFQKNIETPPETQLINNLKQLKANSSEEEFYKKSYELIAETKKALKDPNTRYIVDGALVFLYEKMNEFDEYKSEKFISQFN